MVFKALKLTLYFFFCGTQKIILICSSLFLLKKTFKYKYILGSHSVSNIDQKILCVLFHLRLKTILPPIIKSIFTNDKVLLGLP